MTPARQLAATGATALVMLGGTIGGLTLATSQPARSAIVNHHVLPAGWQWRPAGTHHRKPCIAVWHRPVPPVKGATVRTCGDGYAGTS